jgi:hypothetical protein
MMSAKELDHFSRVKSFLLAMTHLREVILGLPEIKKAMPPQNTGKRK